MESHQTKVQASNRVTLLLCKNPHTPHLLLCALMGVSQISVVTMYNNSHEDQTADAECPLDPELDGDVATKPAE